MQSSVGHDARLIWRFGGVRLDHFNGTGRHRDGSRRRDRFDRNHGRMTTSRVQGSRLVPRCRRLAVSRRLFPLPPPRVAVSRLRGPIHVTTMNSIHDIGSSPHCLSLHVYKSVCRSVEGGRAPLVVRAWALQRPPMRCRRRRLQVAKSHDRPTKRARRLVPRRIGGQDLRDALAAEAVVARRRDPVAVRLKADAAFPLRLRPRARRLGRRCVVGTRTCRRLRTDRWRRRHLDGRRRLGPQWFSAPDTREVLGPPGCRPRGGGGRRRGGRRRRPRRCRRLSSSCTSKTNCAQQESPYNWTPESTSKQPRKNNGNVRSGQENRRDLSYALRDARRLAHHCPTFYKLPHARGGSFFGRGSLPATGRLRSHALYFINWSHTAAAKADGGRVEFVALYFLNPKHTAAAQREAGKDKGDEDHCSHHGRVIIIIIIMRRLGGLVSWTAHGRRLIANHPVVPMVRAVEAPVAAGGFDFAPVEGRTVAGSCWAALLVGAEGVAPRCFARAGLCGSAPEAARQQCHCSEGHAGFEALGGPAAEPQRHIRRRSPFYGQQGSQMRLPRSATINDSLHRARASLHR
mmetsp:Transcript_10397/g.30733  ORF Transcript_10397/g.30733 Transcript_10397/m.30733 type:complete len:573 (-) Transcript_10397:77-1795(-)